MSNQYFKYLLIANSIVKSAALYDDVKNSLKNSKNYNPSNPTYTNQIKIPGINGAVVIVPDNPIINGKYNVLIQIRPGTNATKAGINTIVVNCEAGGMASKENAEKYGNSKWIKEQLQVIQTELSKRFGNVSLGKLGLTSFSGGYQAVGNIIEDPEMRSKINSLIIMDGIHEGKRSNPDPTRMKRWVQFAQEAKNDPKNKQFVFIHSAVDPGSYSSTTDSANYLNQNVGAIPSLTNNTYAGIKPAAINNIGGFTTIQLYNKQSDNLGYGYTEKEMKNQHIMTAKALPDIMSNYLSNWNE